MEAELLIGRSNVPVYKQWEEEIPKIKQAFRHGVDWEPKEAFEFVDDQEKPK